MEILHESIYPLVTLAFALGLKHGMDADHLATIDGLIHLTPLQEGCACTDFGHGAVVCVVAAAASTLFQHASIPSWMDDVGVWVSAFS